MQVINTVHTFIKELKLTDHCQQRMDERDIPFSTVAAVVAHGEVEQQGDKTQYRLGPYRAIACDNRVVTVMAKRHGAWI